MAAGNDYGKLETYCWDGHSGVTDHHSFYRYGVLVMSSSDLFIWPGLEEDNKETSDSHRPSQVDKTEAVSNKCFANNEIIAK